MKIVNLTRHEIVVMGGSLGDRKIAPSGEQARLATSEDFVEEIDGIPFYRQREGRVVGLPAQSPGTVYIVSSTVRRELPERGDLVSPGYPIRSKDGKQQGCRGLVYGARK